MTRWRARHRGARSDRGAAAVEFAIVFVLLLYIIFSIIDFGRLFFVKQGVESASREGARTAAVQSNSDVIHDAIAAAVKGAESLSFNAMEEPTYVLTNEAGVVVATGAIADGDTATIPCAGTDNALTVSVTLPFDWMTPTMPLLGIVVGPANVPSVSAETVMRCETASG